MYGESLTVCPEVVNGDLWSEHRIIDIIGRYEGGEGVNMPINAYEIDDEYKRLWFEMPLPKSVSKLLGEKGRTPVVLFRNLGWLLSDDVRSEVAHAAGNRGQVAARLFDWIAFAKYITDILEKGSPLIFRLGVHKINRTKDGANSLIEVRPIGTTAKIIQAAYERFGIALDKPEEVLARGYAILRTLREEAFKIEGNTYVVDYVGAWIAVSNIIDVLVIGDGYIKPIRIGVVAKISPEITLDGERTRLKELARVLKSTAAGIEVQLQSWYMRLLLPTPLTPSLEKSVKLYETLVSYPAAAAVEINNAKYLLTYIGGGRFAIGKGKATVLSEVASRLGIRAVFKSGMLVLTYAQPKELLNHGIQVWMLNDLEKPSSRK